jgi:transposase
MQVVYERCCGLDIHKKMVVACLSITSATGQRSKELRTFSTMTSDLLKLLDWLTAAKCTHVALESTGVFWKPIFNLLESHVEVLLVNAQHIKAVPGRKTDLKDAPVDCGFAPTWPPSTQFHSTSPTTRFARIDAISCQSCGR